MLSRLQLVGIFTLRVRDARTGRTLRTFTKRNTITYNAGNIVRALLCQRATDTAAGEYSFGSIRCGTDSTAPTRGDTDLLAEVTAVRRELQDSNKTDGGSGEVLLTATLAAGDGNGYTYQEAGVFTLGAGSYDAAVGGSLQMFARQVHPAQVKTAAVTLDYEWAFQFTT